MRIASVFALAIGMGMAVLKADPSYAQTTAHSVCRNKEECRPLTPGEIRLVRSFFGASIDYGNVRVIKGKFWGMVPSGQASKMAAPNGHIYAAASHYIHDYTSSEGLVPFFIHEMAHIWQKYKGENVVLKGSLLNMNIFRDPYKYVLDANKSLQRYSIEQQAEILQHGYTYGAFLNSKGKLYRSYYTASGFAHACRQWTVIHDIASTAGIGLGRKPDLCR